MDNRCENCGRKLPCEPCDARERDTRVQELLDALHDTRGCVTVWFNSPPDIARQHLNRLLAEWPGASEVIEPVEPDDTLGCYIARRVNELGKGPANEWEVTPTRVHRVDDADFWRALQGAFDRKP